MPAENCPPCCRRVSEHYCDEAGTHCHDHCICPCSECVDQRDALARVNESKGTILPTTVDVDGEVEEVLD
jgi:hypothetical protein